MRISLDELEHRFRDVGDPVLRPISHEFLPGTLTAVTGRSGSGKSTLLYLTALMLTPTRGTIRWGDEDVQGLHDAQRARMRAKHAGFVFQDALLDPSRTALENVLEAAWLSGMAMSVAEPRALELLDRFGVGDQTHHRPGQVSGGQAQRISLCRALVKLPDVIFADEPTGNLDAYSADVVWRALNNAAAEGATVIVATHDEQRASSFAHHLRLVA